MKFILASFVLGLFAVAIAAVTILSIVAFLSLIPEPYGVQWPMTAFMVVTALCGITGLGAFLKRGLDGE